MSVMLTDIALVTELEDWLVWLDVGLLVWLELVLVSQFQLKLPMEMVLAVVL